VEKGEELCRDLIDAHDACLRLDGFTVPVNISSLAKSLSNIKTH
jgi:hypothetical protein